MKKKLSILFALVLVISLLLVPATVSASPGSHSTSMGTVGWSGTPFDFTAQTPAGLGWNPLGVDLSYAAGKATFVITSPVAFNPSAWPNDNFWLQFDTDADGTADFQVKYNTIEDTARPNLPDWAYFESGQPEGQVPGDWDVSETGLSEFTVSIPVSYLGGSGSDYAFQIGLVKHVYENDWLAGFPAHEFDPLGGGWSTQALIFVQLPTEGWDFWESETTPANTVVGLNAGLDQITAISVSPTGIDFGTITPGVTATGNPTITVENVGTVTVSVGAFLDQQTAVFQYLFLNGKDHPSSGIWPTIIGMENLLPTNTANCTTKLKVPLTYSAQGQESAQLIFVATATP